MDGVYPIHGHHDTKQLVSCKIRVATAVCAQVRLLPANELFVYSATEPLFRFSIRPSTSTQPPPAPLITTLYFAQWQLCADLVLFRAQKSFYILLLTLAWFCMTFEIIFPC